MFPNGLFAGIGISTPCWGHCDVFLARHFTLMVPSIRRPVVHIGDVVLLRQFDKMLDPSGG